MNEKKIKYNYFFSSLTLFSLALVGSIMLTPTVKNWLEIKLEKSGKQDQNNPEIFQKLDNLSDQEKENQLQEIARQSTLEGARAKYILANKALGENKPEEALQWLDNLEDKYPVLSPYILLKKGQAYQKKNDLKKALEVWQKLLEKHPNSSLMGETLYLLNQFDPQYGTDAIAKLPQHPRTQEIIRQRLQKNPKQPPLMLLLAKYSPTAEGMDEIRQILSTEYASQLKQLDWQIIGDGYWGMGEYDKAAMAYKKSQNTAKNLYRQGRGKELSNQKTEAKTIYKTLIKTYPQDEYTARGLKNLAQLSSGFEALNYYDALINNFPEYAPDALIAKAHTFEVLKNSKTANKTLQLLLEKYPNSEATANYRWQKAEQLAKEGKLIEAWQVAQPITVNNSDSYIAPKAGFWIGKWAEKLNKTQEAQQAFRYVLKNHPQSYYAWRSAVQLGWNVGDFDNVRNLTPTIKKPIVTNVPPAGSQLFQELYQIGEYEDAWQLFEAEIAGKENLTVGEQFTEGLLLQNRGKYLLGINKIFNLKDKTNPEDLAQWKELRKTPEYWYSLFPFPYEEIIEKYALDNQLNPLLVTALMRQESRFEKEIKSPVGALGLMQIMPDTGKYIADNLKVNNYSLTKPDDNIKFGIWYLDYTHKKYDNNSMLAVASYNAGPGNVNNWLQKYNITDHDLFVENIPFPETKNYVESVFGNYWNYLRIYNPEIQQLLQQL